MATLLDNAVFGSGAFGQINRVGDGFKQDPASGQWYQWGQDSNWMGDSSNPGAWNPLEGSTGFLAGMGDNDPGRTLDLNALATPEYFLTGQGLDSFSDKEGVMNPANIKVVGKTEGGYLVMSKTGDKTGAVYAVTEAPDGNYYTAGKVKDGVEWETNSPWWKENIGIISVLAAPLMAGAAQTISNAVSAYMSGAASTLSEALSMGFNGALETFAAGAGAFPTGVADPFMLSEQFVNGAWQVPSNPFTSPTANWTKDIVPDFSSGAAPGESGGRFVGDAQFAPPYTEAYDAAQLLQQGINPNQVVDILTSTGLDEMVAADIVQLTQQGIPDGQIMDIITRQYPPDMLTPGMTNPNVVPPPGTPGSSTTTAPPGNPPPGNPPPGGTPPGGAPPGGTPPGGTTPGGSNFDPLGLLASIIDGYNKYAGGKDIMDFARRIYGKADWFEDQLQQTYQNPDYYFNSPEFQSLARVTENRLRRRDAKLGTMGNDTAFANLFRDEALTKGLNPYRTGLVSAANLGKQNSATALKGFSEGLNQRNSALSPLAFNQGNAGGNVVNQTSATVNDLRNVGGFIRDMWNWGSSFFD
jgi:hypothetical protein